MNEPTFPNHEHRQPLLLTAHEAAELLRVSERTLWSNTQPRGSIPAIRIGRVVRYCPDALREWKQRQVAAALASSGEGPS
jgi:excisionase family DNA binding protein